ncbi:AlpA family phage regulatory protein [Pseudomonas sp. P42]|uniref:AlpA family phage regulatory protein n=1 Tax=Pseudomonas sp. P42 TaxID=1080160 RepID=UPI001B32532B|nr:AlpA family phage regulatory protein [Pseudomonas sp. P42]MBP5953427.1 AlpA family phage regulatory protein [Pseudomonas sp. P42]
MSKLTEVFPKILRLRQVMERTGLGRSTIYDRIDSRSTRYEASFPKPVRIGVSSVGWLESSVNEWISTRLQVKRG